MNNKTIFISGASSEVGIALIKRIYSKYDLIIAHYNSSFHELEILQDMLGDRLRLVQADFSDTQQTDEFIRNMKGNYKYINHIVHLPAQKLQYNKFSKASWEDLIRDINVQLGSIFKISQAYLDEMAKNRSGKIVFMLSSSTISAPKFMVAYSTVKYALLGFVKSLAKEYADKMININAVSPSMIETKFLSDIPHLAVEQSSLDNPMKRNAMVEDVIPIVEFLLSDEAQYITGQNILISGGSVI